MKYLIFLCLFVGCTPPEPPPFKFDLGENVIYLNKEAIVVDSFHRLTNNSYRIKYFNHYDKIEMEWVNEYELKPKRMEKEIK